MADLDDVSIKIKNYKSFGSTEQGYEGIRPINLIIGRNNTGKSTLLDVIGYATEPTDLSSLGHKGQQPQVLVTVKLGSDEISRILPKIPNGQWGIAGFATPFEFGRQWIGKPITYVLDHKLAQKFLTLDPPFGCPSIVYVSGVRPNVNNWEQALAEQAPNPFSGYTFKKLLADRDISPEPSNFGTRIDPNGRGATATIHNFINKVGLPSDLVEKVFLNKLNEIFEPDGTFTDIVVQQLADERWEVYLEESEKGRVPLSHTGSGLKTILLLLSFLYLVPHIEKKSLDEYLFGFEELENNLHPALQRRLLLFLRKIAIEEGCRFFLTTHSNVAIDLFANDDKAQIIHVTHDRHQASVRSVPTYVDNKGILDDLDVRASDIMQSNGVVWLEGPSDRVYFNRWVELYSGGEIREGAHYQCVFYGGRLLAHLSADDPYVDEDEAVKILRVNRNAIVIIDSDRRKPRQKINATKRRIISEIEQVGGMAWVTAGKEVENYVPVCTLQRLFPASDLPPLGQYADIRDYLNAVKAGEGDRFERSKVLFAKKVVPHIDRDGLESVLDLERKIATAYMHIVRWNGASPNTRP